MTRWFRIPLTAAIVVAVVLLVAMAAGGANSTVFERYFPILLIVTSFATIALLAFIGAVVYRLFKQRRNKVFGSRMTINLALYLSLAAVFPCLLLYFVSSQFIGRSIDSWFDVRVEKALESGVSITRSILTEQQHQTEQTAQHLAEMLSNTPTSLIMSDLMRLLENRPGLEALVFSSNGTAIAAAGSRINVLMPELPTAIQMQTVRSSGMYSVIDGDALEDADVLKDGRLAIRVILPIAKRSANLS